MNKRLKELMIQAGYAAPELALRGQRLAELIVEECYTLCVELHDSNMRVAREDLLTNNGRDMFRALSMGSLNAGFSILKHFE